MSLNKSNLKDTWFVSMEGLKPETVYHYLEEAQQVSPSGIEEIALCVDNDEAGKAFSISSNNLLSIKRKSTA